MNKTVLLAAFAALIPMLWAQGVGAASIAPRVPVTKEGKLINYDWKGSCPDEKAVGVPAYPRSVCTKAASLSKSSAVVELLSDADAAEVVSWYAKHLSGWGHTKVASGEIIFTPPGVDPNRVYAGYTDVNVTIEKLSNGKAKLKKMIYAFKGTPATAISIWYAIGGSKQ